ncbi:hypothetical protein D2V17_14375 [Aurantiacibacter xanthus]|uniref:ParB/Sulfiredoxin domain-containing protein n=1 Tax=Aurantiacibacter xanthus TaxID=1784712 RepID=A0A3A1P221_9SPHN|nr:hypothetical protein [Aurantiacibacter xanthus]RIV82984.1 hypothetical protein D2V17_14375 [Aurantiacibacter xanthus]
MNTLLTNATLFELAPTDVFEGDRIGFLHEDKAAALGRLMAVDGQRDPIKVVRNLPSKPIDQVIAEGKKPWRLVTGMHRLIGARMEGITVWAIEVSGKPDQLADLEASENLHRRPLGPIERAKFTAALVQAAQERLARERGGKSQQQLAVKARWDRVKHGEMRTEEALRDDAEDACDNLAQAYGVTSCHSVSDDASANAAQASSWVDSVGSAMELGKREIHRDLAIFRLLIEPFPELIEALSRHPIVGENRSQLKLVQDVKDEAQRREVIEALLEDRDLSADMARAQLGIDSTKGAAPTPDVKFTSTMIDSWGRLSITAKRECLPRFVNLLSKDMKARLRELLDEEDAA